ncbi:MAG: hypothetical protein AABZ56_06785 [Bacteroidota bacterium]
MKKPNTTSWEVLEKAWQKQIQEKEVEVPTDLWDRIEKRLDEKPVRPLWLQISTWAWSAAAVLAIVIGLNWGGDEPGQAHVKTKPKEIPSANESANPSSINQVAVAAQPTAPHAREVLARSLVSVEKPNSPEIAAPVQTEVIAKPNEAKKQEEQEEIWVRVDINPVEEIATPIAVVQQETFPTKKKKSLLGRLIKQVKQIADGERMDWQALKEGNRPLEDGIHQVANTYYRTEQTVKQTFQIQ